MGTQNFFKPAASQLVRPSRANQAKQTFNSDQS